jgi:proteic killer suppression protein
MDVRFADHKLERLESDPGYSAGFDHTLVKAFRKRMALIRNAEDERDFYALKSLHYEKLKGKRKEERSMRLNDQFRLILKIEVFGNRTVVIVGIEDYH